MLIKNAKIGDVAQSLGVSRQTIKDRMAKVGYQYFTEHARRKTGKRFSSHDIDNLQTIHRMRENGESLPNIAQHLKVAPVVIDDMTTEDTPKQTTALQTTEQTELINRMLEQKQETIDTQKQYIAFLEGQLKRYQRPWYKKILGIE